jgi:hypothetical protein
MRSSALISAIPFSDRSAATRTFPRFWSIFCWMTDSISPKSVVRFMSNVSDNFAISASAALIFSSASYFWIFSRSSISFSFAC